MSSAPDTETAVRLIVTETVDLSVVDKHLLDGGGADFIRMAGALPCCSSPATRRLERASSDHPAGLSAGGVGPSGQGRR